MRPERLRTALPAAWRRNAPWLILLRPLSALYGLLLCLRDTAYRRGWREVYRARVPVVVVGNLTVGGTGKTPVVMALAQALQERGVRVGIVSRGYGASPGDFPRRVTPATSWRAAGDEALMLARRTGCPVVVAPKRALAVRDLLDWQPVDIILSDDGLQHRALDRDMEIVLLAAQTGLGNGHLLPAGPLRESASRLERADWILQQDAPEPERCFHTRPDALVNLASGDVSPLADWAGRAVTAVAGIANPERFFATLRTAGLVPSAHVFPDHHAFSAADLARLGDGPLIMTEKDAIKCADFAGPDHWFLRISLSLPAGLVDRVAALLTTPDQQE
jgi:tetraacyldisaccharide 4'-kinase